MKLFLVEITRHDQGWKGSWYRTGERYVATVPPDYPQVYACKFSVDDGRVFGGIYEGDCRVIGGVPGFVACAAYRVRSLFRLERGVMGGQARNCMLRIQIRHTALFIGSGLAPSGWSGARIGMFIPRREDASSPYRCTGFEVSPLPGIGRAVSQWPAWYRFAWRALSFRSRGIC